MHLRQVALKKNISIFFCLFLCFKPRASLFSTGGHFLHRSGTVLTILVEGQAILKILSVCCAPTDPPKLPRPKFFFRYFRFFFFLGVSVHSDHGQKQTSKASSDFQNNQCTPRFKRDVVYSSQFQNDYQLSK